MTPEHTALVARLLDRHSGYWPDLKEEAAAAIRALAGEVDALTASQRALFFGLQDMMAERDKLQAALNEEDLDCARCAAEVAALKEQIDQQHEDLDHFLSGAANDLPKIAALSKDAERYRFWRENTARISAAVSCGGHHLRTSEGVDFAIDAALADKQKET